MKINIVGQTYPSRAYVISANRLVNMYAQKETPEAKDVASLIRCPGTVTAIDTGSKVPIRGAWTASNGASFVVAGDKLLLVNETAVLTSWTLDSSSGDVTMRDNGIQLLLVDGVAGYIVTLATNTFAKIADADFPNGARYAAYIDTYFIVAMTGTQQFFISGQQDGTAWAALDFFAAEGSPDIVRSLIENHRELWLFGARSIEVWSSTTDSSFPFQRASFIEQGCAAGSSVAKMDNSVFWLGANDQGNGIVYRGNGYSPLRISHHAMEYQIAQYQTIEDAIGFCYVMEGHSFYVLQFPTAGKTWVYDAASGLWHERAYFSNGSESRWRSNCHYIIGNRHFVGDYENGKIYQLSSSIYDDDGQAMRCLRSLRVKGQENKPITYSRFILDAETGVGLPNGQGSDPVAMLRISDDGGRTFHTLRTLPLGEIGEFATQAEAWALGQSNDRVFEITISDPVEFVIVGAYLEAKLNG